VDRDVLELVADRFVRLGRRTIDLATGKDVWLRVEEEARRPVTGHLGKSSASVVEVV